MRFLWGIVGTLLFPATAFSGDSIAPVCVEALEQVATIKTQLPVYKFTADGQQQYLQDADRPAEIDRLEEIIGTNCSANPQIRSSEESAAQRLHAIRSPDCAAERDKLALMAKPESRESADSVAEQHRRVLQRCSVAETPANVWLLQMWVRPR